MTYPGFRWTLIRSLSVPKAWEVKQVNAPRKKQLNKTLVIEQGNLMPTGFYWHSKA